MSAARRDPDLTEPGIDGPPTGVLIPEKVLRKSEFPVAANQLNERLLESMDAPTAFVFIKQLGEIVKAAEKMMLERAIEKCAGASVEIGGATVSYRKKPLTWEYQDETLSQYEADIATLEELADARKKMLQALTEPVVIEGKKVLPAVATENGYTLAVTFGK